MRVMKCVEEMDLSTLQVCLLVFSSWQKRKLMAMCLSRNHSG
jgi:hypothetical protein